MDYPVILEYGHGPHHRKVLLEGAGSVNFERLERALLAACIDLDEVWVTPGPPRLSPEELIRAENAAVGPWMVIDEATEFSRDQWDKVLEAMEDRNRTGFDSGVYVLSPGYDEIQSEPRTTVRAKA